MNFEHSVETALPIDTVFNTLRDDLGKLVEYLPNVKEIQQLERHDSKGSVKLINKWYGKYQIPLIVRKVLNISEIAWLDRAEWLNNKYVCNWSIEPMILKDYVDAHGTNVYTSDGEQTIVKITGDISIDISNYSVVPHILKNKVNNEVSRILLALIKPNFTKLVRGLEKYTKTHKLA